MTPLLHHAMGHDLSFRTLLNLTKADLTVEQMPKADPALQNPAKSFGIPKQV
jgi:hypothetical protein